ncbi:unnamed protein product [marine sediment metagenome]|uniref:Uncharacterized protein n=1 Tax=marine sediment metagenome TaxID=412755 RepID=X1PDJ8_9ZZZZ
MYIEILTLVLACFASVLSCFVLYKYRKYEETLTLELQDLAAATQSTFLEEIAPLKNLVNQSMGRMSAQGHEATQLKTAEKYISEDILEAQDPMIIAALEILSPRTKDYLDENPGVIMKLIPRFQALMATGDPLGFLKPDGGSTHGRLHPFRGKEE